jgi:hypothetical protein
MSSIIQENRNWMEAIRCEAPQSNNLQSRSSLLTSWPSGFVHHKHSWLQDGIHTNMIWLLLKLPSSCQASPADRQQKTWVVPEWGKRKRK